MRGVFLPFGGESAGNELMDEGAGNPNGALLYRPRRYVRGAELYETVNGMTCFVPRRSAPTRLLHLRRFAAIPFTRRMIMNEELRKKREEFARSQKKLEMYETLV